MPEWRFTARIIEWRGPAPFYYAPLPGDVAADIAAVKKQASYGWGVIPVNATIAAGPDAPGHGRNRAENQPGIEFETSLFPKDGTYLLPLKNKVRRPLGLTVGDEVAVTMTIGGRIREPDWR